MYTDLSKQFTQRFCETAVEGTIEMMSDQPDEYPTYKEAKGCIEDSIEMFEDSALEDYLSDFCSEVRELVKKRKVKVEDITFDEEGFKSAAFQILIEQ